VSARADHARALRALGIVVSVVSLAAVTWWALRQDAPTLPSTPAAIAEVCAAIALYMLTGCLLRGERWLLLLRENGSHDASRLDCYALSAVGFMGNNVLPARAGDAARVVGMTPRSGLTHRGVIGTLVAERVLDVALLGVIFLVVAFGLLDGIALPDADRFELLLGLGAGVLLLGAIAAAVLHRRGVLERVVHFVRPMLAATAKLRGRHLLEAVALTVAIWGTEILVWFLTGRAAGLDLSVIETCYLISLASIFALVPAGPGYAGTMDAAVIFGVGAIGGSGADALSYLLLLRFVLFVPITLTGLVALVSRYGGMRIMKATPA